MSDKSISLAKQALHSPNGAKHALLLLEEQVKRNESVSKDATIWACIAHLRKKTGDWEGAESATLHARELVGVNPKRLSFDDDEGHERVRGTGEDTVSVYESNRDDGDGAREKCEEMLNEVLKDREHDFGKEKIERLVARSKRLREISDGLLLLLFCFQF